MQPKPEDMSDHWGPDLEFPGSLASVSGGRFPPPPGDNDWDDAILPLNVPVQPCRRALAALGPAAQSDPAGWDRLLSVARRADAARL